MNSACDLPICVARAINDVGDECCPLYPRLYCSLLDLSRPLPSRYYRKTTSTKSSLTLDHALFVLHAGRPSLALIHHRALFVDLARLVVDSTTPSMSFRLFVPLARRVVGRSGRALRKDRLLPTSRVVLVVRGLFPRELEDSSEPASWTLRFLSSTVASALCTGPSSQKPKKRQDWSYSHPLEFTSTSNSHISSRRVAGKPKSLHIKRRVSLLS